MDLDSFRRAARDLTEAEAQRERVRRPGEDYFRELSGRRTIGATAPRAGATVWSSIPIFRRRELSP